MLPHVAEPPYLKHFRCFGLPTVSACCALDGVRSGVNAYGILHGPGSRLPLLTLQLHDEAEREDQVNETTNAIAVIDQSV